MRTFALLAAAVLVTMVTPVGAHETHDVLELNKAFFADKAEALGVDPTAPEAAAAIEAAAERAGAVNLAALATGAAPPPPIATGDAWLIEVGPGPCPTTTVHAPGVPPSSVPQANIYPGDIGTATSSNAGLIIEWTTKTTKTYPAPGVTITGQSDFYCAALFGIYIWFPFLSVGGTVVPN